MISRYYSPEGFMLRDLCHEGFDISVTFSLIESINLLRQKNERKTERGRKKEIKDDRRAFYKANEGGNGRCVFA